MASTDQMSIYDKLIFVMVVIITLMFIYFIYKSFGEDQIITSQGTLNPNIIKSLVSVINDSSQSGQGGTVNVEGNTVEVGGVRIVFNPNITAEVECCASEEPTCEQPCTTEGLPCDGAGGTSCCDGTTCQYTEESGGGVWTCQKPQESCRDVGELCTSTNTCCSGLQCSSETGTCEVPCRAENEVCSSTLDCCGYETSTLTCQYLEGQGVSTCRPPPAQCGTEGTTCTSDSQCCADQGLTCQYFVTGENRCQPAPQTCSNQGGTCAVDSDCCSGLGLTCQSGACQPAQQQHTELCSSTGPETQSQYPSDSDGYLSGASTGYLDSAWGTYSDFCQDSGTLVEYYCHRTYDQNNPSQPILDQTVSQYSVTCLYGCDSSLNACKNQCVSSGDEITYGGYYNDNDAIRSGSSAGYLNGVSGTYSDSCSGTALTEYRCELKNNIRTEKVVSTQINCQTQTGYGCSVSGTKCAIVTGG